MNTLRVLELTDGSNPCRDRSYTMNHLTSSIVHDLRNPLSAICGCAEMLLDANLAPAQTRRVASNIYRAASRMREQLAEFTRIVRGQSERAGNCNLREILAASCEAAGAAERDDIEVLLDVPARLNLPVARTRMESVFMNLILNALEAMPGGGAIWITATEMDDYVLIVVEDNGPGSPAEIRGRLFEPLATAGKKGGLGLGLALSRQTVREYGGDLWTEPADGARFVLFVPLRRPSL
jgi:signal transduction histidine kinase